MEIDFDKLLENYNSELVTKLRGFNDEHDYLQYWVPGSDKVRSLLNLIDAIYETGTINFSVLLSKKDEYIINEIKKISNNIGKAEVSQNKNTFKILISLDKSKYKLFSKEQTIVKKKYIQKNSSITTELKDERKDYDIFKDYEANLSSYKLVSNYNKKPIDESVFFEFVNKNKKLFIKINKDTQKVVESWHDFNQIDNQAIVVDKFCQIILNKTIQEASEHGIIYLEHSLRPLGIRQKIKGIILPKKAGGIFFDLHQCINKIYIKIKEKFHFNDVINKEYFDLSENWLKNTYEQKLNKLRKVLSEKIIPSLQLKQNDIIIEAIEIDTKIVIKTSDDFLKKNSGKKNYLIIIEDLFKQFVDKRLELFTIEKKDDNRLRHINSPQKI